jgi:CRISPR-associated protein Cas2
MIVLILEKAPTSLRGEITRWMIELQSGVFAGNLSALVRDKLWEYICSKINHGSAMMLQSAANEQGYIIRTYGKTSRKVRSFDGLTLITVPINKNSSQSETKTT